MNTTQELFLTEYFTVKAVLGGFSAEADPVFYGLGRIFMLSDDELETLRSLSSDEKVEDIRSENDFMQYQRVKKYMKMNDSPEAGDPAVEEVINVKGNAILSAAGNRLIPESDVSRNALYSALTAAADLGNVAALRLAGILQCEGAFFEKNTAAGLKDLSKAADWNDCVSLLALLCYDGAHRAFNAARLYTAVKGTPFEGLYHAAALCYGTGAPFEVCEVKLLNKSFNSCVLKRETYEPKYARVLYSAILGYKDKVRAMAVESKELLSAYADLPLKLGFRREREEFGQTVTTALNRTGEQEKLSRALANADLRRFKSYRPLCICSDSEYLLNAYADAIAANYGGHTEKIEAANLSDYDFEPTANNIFVRSIDEGRGNCFMLFAVGKVSDCAENAIKGFLQGDKRAKFHLNSPNVTLDLSEVLPVCFCDGENLKRFKDYCDVVTLADISGGEMQRVIDDMLDKKNRLYMTAGISLTREAVDYITKYDADAADSMLDRAIRANRAKNGAMVLTRENLQPFADEGNGLSRIGFVFGGKGNEN